MATETVVLPGDIIPPNILPVPPNASPLKIGPGLRHIPPSSITAVLAGPLTIDRKKNAIWIENTSGRYVPQTNDLVLAIVQRSSADFYHCAITPHTPLAQLPHLAFEGASRKSRPQLVPGSLIYARISSASKHLDPELTCCNPSTGKSENMGELSGGMVFDVSLGMARRLLLPRQREDGAVMVLEGIAEQVAFEVAVGRNGRVWVCAGNVREVLIVGKALQETDNLGLGIQAQERLVRKLLREL